MASTDPQEVEQQLWQDQTGTVGLDVGARGGESIEDFKRCSFTDITCFEPSRDAFSVLEPYALDLGVKAYQLAISDHSGVVELYSVPRAMAKGELVSAVDGMEWSLADWVTAKAVTVGCISLDAYCATRGMPDLIKIDVEGHEDKVLAGAYTVLNAAVSNWIIEFHSPLNHVTCLNLLEANGYEVTVIRHPHYTPESHMWHQHGWLRADKR